MTLRRWTLILLLVNGGMLLVNAYYSSVVREAWLLNIRISEMNREVTEQLLPHPCRSVILPGEKCTATMMFKLPAPDPSL